MLIINLFINYLQFMYKYINEDFDCGRFHAFNLAQQLNNHGCQTTYHILSKNFRKLCHQQK